MKFKAEIDVMPLDALLDPQGKAVSNSMGSVGLPEIEGVRIGKHIRLFVDAKSEEEAKQLAADLVCSLQGIKLLTLSFKDPNFLIRQGQILIEKIRQQ